MACGQWATPAQSKAFAHLCWASMPLLAGVLLFSLASLACALAPSLEWLIGARFVQALGGCAGMVVSRAVVRDLCDPINSAKAFSQDVGDGAGPDPRAAGR